MQYIVYLLTPTRFNKSIVCKIQTKKDSFILGKKKKKTKKKPTNNHKNLTTLSTYVPLL